MFGFLIIAIRQTGENKKPTAFWQWVDKFL
jgi:hypothetical protein